MNDLLGVPWFGWIGIAWMAFVLGFGGYREWRLTPGGWYPVTAEVVAEVVGVKETVQVVQYRTADGEDAYATLGARDDLDGSSVGTRVELEAARRTPHEVRLPRTDGREG